MSKKKRKFVARWGVAQLKPGNNSETLYWKDSLPFKSSGVTAAKAQATRLLKADENVVNLLASEHYPELFELQLKGWEQERPHFDDSTMMVCSRRSEHHYKFQGIHEASITQWAFLHLFWKKEAENSDEPDNH